MGCAHQKTGVQLNNIMVKKQKKTKEWKRRQKRIKERERSENAINASQEKLLERLKENTSLENYDYRINRCNSQKMSEIILDFAQPLLDVAQSAEDQHKMISMAIILWNLAFLPDEKQKEVIEELVHPFQVGSANEKRSEEIEQVVTYFIKRKKILYPHVNRMILDFECIETSRGFHLNVISSDN